MHPAYFLFLQKLNTCGSLAVKWHPIKNVCSKNSAQSVFLCFLHFFFFYKQSQYIWSKVLKRPNAELPNEENCNNVCRVGEITLKVEYSNTNSIATALKLKKELFSVIYARPDLCGWVKYRELSRLFAKCVCEKIKTLCELLELQPK